MGPPAVTGQIASALLARGRIRTRGTGAVLHDDLRDQAALVGVHGHPRASRVVARVLRALAHRGGEAAGIVSLEEGAHTRREASAGFLDDEPGLEPLIGEVAMGMRHDRLLSADARLGLVDGPAVPRVASLLAGPVAVAVAGAFVERIRLRRELLGLGAVLGPDTADELLLQLIAASRQRTLVNRVVDALWRARGAYGALVAAPGVLIGVRDPHGIRPLVLGRLDGATVVTTEGWSIDAAGGTVLRALAPGEMVIVDAKGPAFVTPFPKRPAAPCSQEWAQLAHVRSALEGATPWEARRRLGEELAYASPADVDVVVPSHGGAQGAAAGFGAALRKPVQAALVTHDGGLTAVPELVAGQRVALVGLAPGERTRSLVGALRGAGATEVHVRGATPRRTADCPYGVSGSELPAAQADGAWAQRMEADTASWLPLQRFQQVLVELGAPDTACTACVGGVRPLGPEAEADQLPLFAGPRAE